ncbi:hypothetical protein Q7P37_000265 [Cladosporium fusiforme]
MATDRPQPPILPESQEQFERHVFEHPAEWLEYYKRTFECFDRYEDEISGLTTRTRDYESQLSELHQALAQKEKEVERGELKVEHQRETFERAYDRLQTKLLETEAEKTRALTTTATNVTTPNTTPPAEPVAEASTAHAHPTPPPIAATPSQSSNRSTKHPDPEKFNGSRADLRRFVEQVFSKMKSNADHFTDAQSRMRYVASRLEGRAFELILPYASRGDYSLTDYEEILDMLNRAFGDTDLPRQARNRLYSLRQKNQEFSAYFAEFQRLALEGQVPEGNLYHLLEQSVSNELSEMMLHNPPPSEDYYQLSRHLQDLDNRRRRHFQTRQHAPPKSYTAAPTTRHAVASRVPGFGVASVPDAHVAMTQPTQRTLPGEPMDLSTHRRYTNKESGSCFRCHKLGHRVRDCPEPDTRPLGIQRRDSDARKWRMQSLGVRSPSPTSQPLEPARLTASVYAPTPVRPPTPAFAATLDSDSENNFRLEEAVSRQ